MKTKLTPPSRLLTLIFLVTMVLFGCGQEKTKPREEGAGVDVLIDTQVNEKQTIASGEPNESSFNLQQVIKDYGETPLTILDVSERSKDGKNSVAITLSVPLDPSKNHQQYFNISATGKGAIDGAWIISKSGKTVWFPYVEPDSSFDVTIYQGLVAANGKALSKTINKKVNTSSLTASINFDTTGAFLTQGLGNGLPVVSVNIESVDLNFYQVNEKDRQHFLQEMSYKNYRWDMKRITQFSKLVYSGRYELNPAKNTRVKRSINIEGIAELSEPGIYLAVMTQAGAYDNHQVMWFSVTDIGLHARFYNEQLDVYASSLRTGKAIENVAVTLVNNKGNILQQGVTSPSGEASFTSNLTSASLIIAQNEQHFSIIELNKPALDLSDFDLGLRPYRAQELFIYAPRNLYRPAEFVDFNALLRNDDGKLTVKSILSAAIKSPDGSKIKTFKWQGDQQGYYHYQWQIPTSAPLGNWQLEVENVNREKFTYDFKVEEFLPERLKITFNAKAAEERLLATKKQGINLPILGEYLFGAPASGNRLSTQVNTTQWRNPVETLPAFEFGDIKQTRFNNRTELKDIVLDATGRANISYQGDWQGLHSPLKVNFISSLFESGGRPVTRAYSALVWPSDKMLGIRSSFGEDNPAANSTVSFDIVKASLDGTKHAASALDIKLIREDRRYFWVYSQHRGWHYEWNDNEYVELTSSLTIKAGATASVDFPVSWGRYRLEVRDTNSGLLSSLQFYAGTNWYADWKKSQSGSGAARPDKVTMALDKASYAAGDIVKVNIVPPQAGEAIILVEGNNPLWSTRQFIPAEGATVEIPLSAGWQQHNIYISALVLQPGDKINTITPKRSFGLVHLPLQRDSQQLNIEFEVTEKALPNKVLPVKIKVTNKVVNNTQAAPIAEKAFVTLAAVDVGVLSISDFKTPDPFEAFFGQRRYNVDSRDVYSQVIEVNKAENARLRFGGDSDLTRGGKEPQSDVQIVSLFSGLVSLDEKGEVIIPLDIPDFNGRIRLMALSFSADKFGHNDKEVTIAAPIITQLAMPRFLAMGDETTLALDVTNLSGEQQQLTVQLSSSGPVAAFERSKNITLEEGEKITLNYAVKALAHEGKASFSLNISGIKLLEDVNRQWSLGLRPAYPATLTRSQKVLQQGESLRLDPTIAQALFPETVQASLTISPKANIDLQAQLTHLLQYPYGCLEQTSSRAYPLLFATPDKQKSMGLKTVSEDKRLDMINKGIERLAMLQLSNGGYGLWNNTSAEEHWLTAYVADFLLNARDMGIVVPEEMLAKTLTRLQNYLARTRPFYNERWSDDGKHYYFAYKAYAAYVLSRVNQAPLGTLRHLTKNHSASAKTGLSQIHLALALFNMGDKKRGEQLVAIALNNLPQKRQQYLADYGSQIRDLALMIHLMLKHDKAKEEAIALSFTLAKQVHARQYLSTQERNALFLAGLSLQAFEGKPWSANVILGAANNKLSQTSVYQQGLSSELLRQEVSITSDNKHPLLANISVSGYGKKAPKESADGLAIQRQWLSVKGKETSIEQVKVGQLFLVHLQVSAKQRTPDALVVDLLPAGFELENQNLSHSIKLDELKVDGKTIEYWQKHSPISYQEYRDDRFVAALDVRQHRTAHLFYLVRAVTPGVYKVPAPLVEDMYRPELRGIGATIDDINISQ